MKLARQNFLHLAAGVSVGSNFGMPPAWFLLTRFCPIYWGQFAAPHELGRPLAHKMPPSQNLLHTNSRKRWRLWG